MGIPSFYRQLCRQYPRLIAKTAGQSADWLCLDFNCAMYHVLRQAPAFPSSHESKKSWETNLCKAIATYMTDIIVLGAPTKGVYVSCDGAVCAAKRRQQRLRRFKGPWASLMEAQVTGQPKVDGWDQNALTPGSAFMSELGDVLTATARRLEGKLGIPVIVSTTKEAGEGEHKLMTHMRLVLTAGSSCTIYGLDADLILLAMLLGADTGASVRLLREAQEFEGGSGSETNQWRSLDVSALAAIMIPACSPTRIRDFVAAMSLLGNDFLPRSLTRTVRDDGIPVLISDLEKHVWAGGLCISESGQSLSRTGLLALIRSWAATEERDLVVAATSAIKASRRPAPDALREWNAQPARWATAAKLLKGTKIYDSWHPGSAANYAAGLAWIWDYYSGRPVDQGWCFDEHLPPLWSKLADWLDSAASVEPPAVVYPKPLPDQLHLLSVLPAASVERLLPPKYVEIMRSMPWYWPTSWSVHDVGKTQLWECEPMIPLIPEAIIRRFIDKNDVIV